MRCNICDKELETVHFNRDHGDFDPCPECLEIIENVFSDEYVPSEDESEEITEEEVDALLAAWDEINLSRIDVV